ncbi:MAG: helix-turn-helix transcriptional regulator [Clostridiaceae bacterium]|nr:helix-turn-helix transcriptional regulator [Clostridiaceae bacterium]
MASFYEACRGTKDVWPRVEAYYSKTWKDYQMEPHSHIACELMYVFSGKCLVTYQDGEAEMRSGDYIFLDSNIPHALITTAAGCTMLNVEFTLDEPNDFYTVQRLLNSSVYFREMIRKKKPVFVGNDADGELFRSLDTLVVGLSAKKERDQCLARGEMAAFLLTLSQSMWENDTQINANRYVRNAMLYIQHHFREKVTISQLAERQSITSDHLNRIFKESTGLTLHTFLTRVRCEHAATLLLRENSTTEDIALQCGFSSQQQFVRDFRKFYIQTPARYRRQSKRIEFRNLEERE